MLDPLTDTVTITVNLPQPINAVASLLAAVAEIWPDAVFSPEPGPLHIEIAASEGTLDAD
jgi:hypothetical protein